MIQPRADSTGTPEVFKGLVVPDGRGSGLLEVGVRDGACVAGCGADAEPEEVADSADVAAVGVDLLEDSVLAQGLWAEVGVGPRELSADGPEPWCVAHADEKVRVDAARPFDRPVVEPCGESTEDGVGEGDVPVVDVEASVDDVGELKVLHFFGGEGVKGDQSDGEGGGWVWEFKAWRTDSVSSGRGTVAFTRVVAIPAVGLVKISFRLLRTPNSDRSPYSAKLRCDPLSGSASRTCACVISERDRCPLAAQAWRIGAIPRMWMRVVCGSRACRRGAVGCRPT